MRPFAVDLARGLRGAVIGQYEPQIVASPWGAAFGKALVFDGVNRGTASMGLVVEGGPVTSTFFCLEARFRPDVVNVTQVIAGRSRENIAGGIQPTLVINGSDGKLWGQVRDNTGTFRFVASLAALVPGTNYDAAFEYDGTDLRLLLNGVVQSTLAVGGIEAPNAVTKWMIGRDDHFQAAINGGRPFDGTIDAVRLSDTARYTGAYVPAAAPWPVDANTVVQFNFDGPGLFGGPLQIFEVSYDTDAWATPTWTDESASLIESSSERGRQHQLQRFDAGRSRSRLKSYDRRFDPTYAAGPLGGKLLPGVRHRMRVNVGGTFYPIFHTWAERWQPKWRHVAAGETELTGVDSFKALRKKSFVTDTWAGLLYSIHSVTAHYRFGAGAEQTLIRDSGPSGLHGNIGFVSDASPKQGQEGALITELDGGLQFPHGGDTFTDAAVALPASIGAAGSGAITVGMFIKITPTTGALPRIDWRKTPDAAAVQQIIVAPVGEGIYYTDGSGIFIMNYTDAGLFLMDGQWHLWCWTRAANGLTNTLTVDGLTSISANDDEVVNFTAASATPTRLYAGESTDPIGQGPCGVDELFVIHGYAMPAASQRTLYLEARGKWAGQRSGQRVGVALDTVGWPAGDRVIDTGQSTLATPAASLASTKVLDYLQKVEQSESGYLFQNADGKIVFINRQAFLAAPYTVSQATFGDGGGSEIPYDPAPEMWLDDTDVYPEAISSRVGGQPQRAIDNAAEDRYGPATLSIDSLLYDTDNQALDLSNWNVQHYKSPVVRVGKIRIHAGVLDRSLWPTLLGLEIGERVTVLRRPVPKTTPAATFDQLVESIAHTFTENGDWWIELALGPTDNLGPYWILGTSALGSTTKLAM